ncbi:RNA 2',3'-cyclic phosphodiesterase [Jannaschia pohangensis]|uniref:RNA 2',3'-cyclic phosphodiesterase n=1 Tax=Jannaschia pohangensis TaxID=390807 RepID=A0A1I3NQD6_9RHOB|nr:RNA 2',3'-cyclic phosphodiesterase [Jannaschia pohangensis]SFJ11474.1 2'-5' RNA ligase [Jannaschia pohangensis]
MRAFLGLAVRPEWIGPLVSAQGRLRGGNRVGAEDLHVTLAFLDDQPEAKLEALHEALDTRRLGSAEVQALAYAVLGSSRARAVVLDLVANAGLAALRDTVRTAARSAGIDLPRERFRPHVTLVRFAATAPADADRLQGALTRLGAPDLPTRRATGLTLWSSVLTPDGPIYDTLSTYPLRAA